LAVAEELADVLAAPQVPPSQQSHAPEAQQPASQTHGPPLSQAQPSSTQAQSVQLQAAPQQQLACLFADERAGAANTAASETVTKPKIAAIYFNMIQFLKTCISQNKEQNTCAQRQTSARSGIQFRQTQKAICKEVGRGGGPKSASRQPSATTGMTAGNCQSAYTVVAAGALLGAESCVGDWAGSRLAGTAVHSQPLVAGVAQVSVFAQQLATGLGDVKQFIAEQQQDCLVPVAVFVEQQADACAVPQSIHAQAVRSGGKIASASVARLKTSQWADRQWRRKYIPPFSQVPANDQG
jgi:hypothetical protein